MSVPWLLRKYVRREKEVAKLKIAEAAFFKMEEFWTSVNAKDKGKHECKS